MPRAISMLIADDSTVAQEVLSEATHLSKLPVRLTSTDNGRDCLTLLNGANVDIAFIDVHMPELSGTEAMWSARKQGNQTFITLMSTPPATEAVEVAIRLRAYEFLFKPFGVADALAIMKTYNRITSPTKVLIVDDSSAVRQIVQKIVGGSVFNCEVTEAGNGDEALALARMAPFDAVFLDCNMPGLSGLATIKQLLLIQPMLKVVMISAERSRATEDAALEQRRLRIPAQAIHLGRRRSGAACRLRFALAEPEDERQRSELRRGNRGVDHPFGAQIERPHFRIFVVRAAALPAQRRGPPGAGLRGGADPGRAGCGQGRIAAIALGAARRGLDCNQATAASFSGAAAMSWPSSEAGRGGLNR